ncbi:hypothetical protein Leryth_003492 [Lithospermum erythrorhizon]|nr:hypothetical protein Leryth_003492 [Lithospermum erythrorhizon]
MEDDEELDYEKPISPDSNSTPELPHQENTSSSTLFFSTTKTVPRKHSPHTTRVRSLQWRPSRVW